MNVIESAPRQQLKKIIIIFNILWTLLSVGTYLWIVQSEESAILRLAEHEAKASYDKDVLYREWAAGHGGVYVIIDSKTPPNPYLQHVPDHNVTTTSGKKLTLVNPAYMTRQVHELAREKYGVKGHITSLKPIRPENKPDEWEQNALKTFENGEKSITAVSQIDGKPYLRYIERFIVEDSCLKCHSDQGYQAGDVRGGISISVPLSEYYEISSQHARNLSIALLTIWFAGLCLFNLGAFILRKNIKTKEIIEKNLSLSEERFKRAEKGSSSGLWDWDVRTGGQWWSEEFYRLLGYQSREMTASLTNFRKNLHPDDLSAVQLAAKNHFKQKIPFNLKYRLKTKSGEYKWFRGKGQAIWDENGKPTKMSGSIEDITELQKAVSRLREGEERYRQMFLDNKAIKLLIDPAEGEIVEANDAACQFYKFSKDKLIGMKMSEINMLSPDQIQEEMNNANMQKRNSFIFQHKIATGEIKTVEVFSGPIKQEKKTLLFSIVQDITQRVQAEEQLLIQKRILNKSQEIAKLGSWHLDIKNNILTWSDEEYRIFGQDHENFECTYEAFLDTVHPDDREMVNQMYIQAIENNEPYECTHRLLRPDGEERIVVEKSEDIVDENGETKHSYGFTQDITEQYKAEKERLTLERKLQQSQKMEAIGTVAGGIAHDFNNILAIIIAANEAASEDSPDELEIKKFNEMALQAANRAKDLVKQILAFSRQSTQELVPLKLHLIIKEDLKLLRSTIPSSIEIYENIQTRYGYIKGDPTQINQLLLNLCTNAVHAMNEKGILMVELKEVSLDADDLVHKPDLKPGHYQLLSVQDTGKGMKQEIVDQIFVPFYTTKEVGEGTGMGLSVVHGIVEGHGGLISVESEVGVGTTFYIYFPIIKTEKVPDQIETEQAVGGHEHVLFIDDELMIAELGGKILERLGYQVTIKTSGSEALETFKSDPQAFDLVITDQTMPNIPGAELAVEMLQLRQDIPIILCTGYSTKITKESAKELGIREFLLKPFNKNQIAESIRKVLDS